MDLVRKPDGNYETADGRYTVGQEASITECDEPHPIRFSREMIRRALSYTTADAAFFAPRHGESRIEHEDWYSIQAGKKGRYCYGGEEHEHEFWYVWDNEADDYYGGQGVLDLDSFAEAVGILRNEYDVVTVRRPRRNRVG